MGLIDYLVIAIILLGAGAYLFFCFRKTVKDGVCSGCDMRERCLKRGKLSENCEYISEKEEEEDAAPPDQ